MREKEETKWLNGNIGIKNINYQINEVYDITVQALEKQIPRKVVEPFGRGEGCYCPSCGTGVSKDYCGNCGQRLDWRD